MYSGTRHLLNGLAVALLLAMPAAAQSQAETLKKLALEDLVNIRVDLVSKRPAKLFESASAVEVLTQEEIRRSGAVTLPEVLQLTSSLAVARTNAHDWAISARGFNGAPLANNAMSDKLLVMIDGRAVYSPLFGGVFWDIQHVLLEDVERIEIIAGPGGTLWGANAVNGVINVVLKTAQQTQGLYTSVGGGSFLQDFAQVRYGDRIATNLFYRAYVQRLDVNGTTLFCPSVSALCPVVGASPKLNDDWRNVQGGFRLDYARAPGNTVTFEGDVARVREGIPTSARAGSDNALVRWSRTLSERSDIRLQAYYDRATRSLPLASFVDNLHTYDLDFQHHMAFGPRHNVLWGAGYRWMRDDARDAPTLAFQPARLTMTRSNVFVQDEIAVVPDRVNVTLGLKLEHDDYSGTAPQPSARVAWTPTDRHTVWGAASRAVHTPSRFDADVTRPLGSVASFTSEKMSSFELGYRVRPVDVFSLSVSSFFNHYTDLRSINFPPLRFDNGQEADTRGLEISGTADLAGWWRLRGGYTYLHNKVRATMADVFPGADAFEAIDPKHHGTLHSMIDLPGNFQFDVVWRSVGSLPASPITGTPVVPDYSTGDVRLAWEWRRLELSFVGRDLGPARHREFGRAQISKNAHVRATVRW